MFLIKNNLLKLPKIFYFLIISIILIILNFNKKKLLFFTFLFLTFLFLINQIFKKNYLNSLFLILFLITNLLFYKKINLFKEKIYSDFKTLIYFKDTYGTVLKKDIKEKKFIYTIEVKNKLLKNNNIIKIISKIDIIPSSFIKIKNIYWLNNKENIKNKDIFFKNFLKTKVSNIGVSKNIKIYNEKNKLFLQKIINFFEKLKIKIINQVKKNFNKDETELFNAIFLGKNKINNLENYLKFKEWGTIHHLVRAGLHANMIYSSIIIIFSLFFKNFYLSNLLSFIFLIFFYLTTFSSLPFERAIIMFLFYFICKIRNVLTTPLHVFSTCSIFFLLNNPFLLFDLSFQLSFFATGIFAILNYSKNNF